MTPRWENLSVRGLLVRLPVLPLFSLLLSSCAHNPAPHGWTPAPADSWSDPFGAWVVVDLQQSLEDRSILPEGTVCDGPAVLFAEPDLESARKGVLQTESRVRITARTDRFRQVECMDGRFGWVFHTNVQAEDPAKRLQGELLSVEENALFLLNLTGVIAIPKDRVSHVSMFKYYNHWGRLVGWSAAGAIGTAAHGIYGLFSLPLWLGTGIAVTSSASRAARVEHPGSSWEEFRAYARFPLGIPPGFSDQRLRPKSTRG